MHNLKIDSLNKINISSIGYKSIVVLIIVLVYSCNHISFENQTEMMNYLKDQSNGFVQHKTINKVDFNLMYRPTDLMVNQEVRSNNFKSKKIVDSLRDKYSNYIYFNLSISKNNKELLSVIPRNTNEFSVLSNKLSFDMGDNVFLYTKEKDTLEMIDYIYPKMYGASNSTKMLFVFDRNDLKLNKQDLNFSIKDFGLGTGEVNFKIDYSILNNEPKLVFKL